MHIKAVDFLELWAMELDRPLEPREEAWLLEKLPDGLRAELSGRKNEEHRHQSLCAYLLLALALRERLGIFALPEICRTEKGKPWFPARSDVHFSVSHTDGAVLVGLSDREIGVDLEKCRPVSRRMMELLPEGETEFFSAWARWEACAKCLGIGVLPLLRGKEIPPDITYQPIELFAGYCAGAAVKEKLKAAQVHICKLDKLLE